MGRGSVLDRPPPVEMTWLHGAFLASSVVGEECDSTYVATNRALLPVARLERFAPTQRNSASLRERLAHSTVHYLKVRGESNATVTTGGGSRTNRATGEATSVPERSKVSGAWRTFWRS